MVNITGIAGQDDRNGWSAWTGISSQDTTVQQYRSIVNQADRFEVYFIDINKTIRIPADETKSFKDVITTDIKPEMQRVFIGNIRIDFFRGNQRIGYLMLENSKGADANFNSDSLNFGFGLTYRIGMWLGNMIEASPRL